MTRVVISMTEPKEDPSADLAVDLHPTNTSRRRYLLFVFFATSMLFVFLLAGWLYSDHANHQLNSRSAHVKTKPETVICGNKVILLLKG